MWVGASGDSAGGTSAHCTAVYLFQLQRCADCLSGQPGILHSAMAIDSGVSLDAQRRYGFSQVQAKSHAVDILSCATLDKAGAALVVRDAGQRWSRLS